ncbi:hypothetical protein M0802_003377 [Mischocyttarus mexicanus]|nr:hypothetical protein M0802_003377 [Mischocyttarus mexicanus]
MSINSSKRTGKDNLTKPAIQSQLARLKREEEEELWISGEELCTEGSSDEEDSKACSRLSYRTNRNHDSRNSSSGRYHWIVGDNIKKTSARLNCNCEIRNTIPSAEIINSFKVNTPNTQSNSSIESEMNVSTADDTSCSDVTQDEEESFKDFEISWKVNRGTIRLLNTGAKVPTTELDKP